MFHEYVNEVFDDTARLFLNGTLWAIINQFDDVGMVQTFKNLDLSFDWFDVFLIFLEEFFSE